MSAQQWSTDDHDDLMALIDSDPIHAGDSARIKAAILADGKWHGGTINPNRVRDSLRNVTGELDVWHKSVGPAYSSLKAAGLIVEGPPIRSQDTSKRGRNAGRWIATYELTAAGWKA